MNINDPTIYNNGQNLHTVLQYSMLSYFNFKTDDPLIDTLITYTIFSLIASIVPLIQKIPVLIINFVSFIFKLVYRLILKLIEKCKPDKLKKVKKNILVEKITDDRQINPLYTACAWYLMNQVNLNEEPVIKCIIDEKINENTSKMPNLLTRVVQNSERKMEFEGKIINYRLSASKIEIDGDDETRSRRNDTIEIWMDTDRENDTFLQHFVKVCMEKYMTYIKNKMSSKYIFQNMNGTWTKVCLQSERMADTIVLKANDKEILMSEIEHFINNKEWYTNHGFLYSLGILFHGSPGTGKTSLIRYISTITGRNTHYLRLSQVKTESEFNNLLKSVDLSDTVLVMEDIDCAGKMVHNREKIYEDEKKNKKKENKEKNKEKENDNNNKQINIVINKDSNESNKDKLQNNDRVTLDVLLNILDGILTTPGQIVVMTTNYKDVLDHALIRPGRIDICLELSKCTHDMIRKLCCNFYEKNESNLKEEELVIIESIPEKKYTPAYVMNIFRNHKDNVKKGLESIHVLEDDLSIDETSSSSSSTSFSD